MMELLEAWQRKTGDPHPLTAAEREPMEFDYRKFEREPDPHQPETIRGKYFQTH